MMASLFATIKEHFQISRTSSRSRIQGQGYAAAVPSCDVLSFTTVQSEEMRERDMRQLEEELRAAEEALQKREAEGKVDEEAARALAAATAKVKRETMKMAVQDINYSSSELRYVPRSIFEVEALTFLRLDHNSIESVPDGIAALVNLEELWLNDNKLTGICDAVYTLTKLKFFSVQDNRISKLGEGLGNLAELELLGLSNNVIAALPESIGQLERLEKIGFASNRLKRLPETFGQLKSLKMVWGSGNYLEILPDSFKDLKNVTWIELEGNKLSFLPELDGLEKLAILNVSHNKLEELPHSISGATFLRVLRAGSNCIEAVPRSLGKLTNLTWLGLRKNNLKKFSSRIVDSLPMLSVLELDGNELTAKRVKRLNPHRRRTVKAARRPSALVLLGEAGDKAHELTTENSIRQLDLEGAFPMNAGDGEEKQNDARMESIEEGVSSDDDDDEIFTYEDLNTEVVEYLVRHRHDVRVLFKQMDTSGDGLISQEEFRAGVDILGLTASDEEIVLLMKVLDEDGDGMVNYRELSRFLSLTKKAATAKLAREAQEKGMGKSK